MISAYLNGNELSFAYDSANRLISAGQNSYTYNVENVRVRNLCGESETTCAISGKGNNERVSLFLGAYAWHHKADYFTGEWTTSYIGYGTPWSNEIIPNR